MKTIKAALHNTVRAALLLQRSLDFRAGAIGSAVSTKAKCKDVEQNEGCNESYEDQQFHDNSPLYCVATARSTFPNVIE